MASMLPSCGLRNGVRPARQDLSSGVLGVDGVVLARQSPLALAGRAVYLLDLVSLTSQEPGQSDAVGACALDTERLDRAGRTEVVQAEREQLRVPGSSGRDGYLGQFAAKTVEQDSDVLVLVRVDTDDDIVAP